MSSELAEDMRRSMEQQMKVEDHYGAVGTLTMVLWGHSLWCCGDTHYGAVGTLTMVL